MNFLGISSRISSLVNDSYTIHNKSIRIPIRIGAQSYDGTVNGLRSMLINEFNSLLGPAAEHAWFVYNAPESFHTISG